MKACPYRLLGFALWCWSLVPLLTVASIYAEGLYVTYKVGHFPILCVTQSPKDTISQILSNQSGLCILALFLSPFVWSLFQYWNMKLVQQHDWRISTGIYLLGFVSFITVCKLDPTGIFAWWFD